MKRQRGVTLIDTVVALALLALFVTVAGAFTVRVARVQRDAHRHTTVSAGLEAALRALRADVWSTPRPEIGAGGGLALESATWRYDAEAASLMRIETGGAEPYPYPCPLEPAWSVVGGGVMVTIGADQIALPSQRAAFTEARR